MTNTVNNPNIEFLGEVFLICSLETWYCCNRVMVIEQGKVWWGWKSLLGIEWWRKVDWMGNTFIWFISRRIRNRLIHALNGNPMRRKKGKGKLKNFATSSFPVHDRTIITKALSKLCVNLVDWTPIKYGFRFVGEAEDMDNFIVSFWSSKSTVSLSGKGALSAKRWLWMELAMDTKSGQPEIYKPADL